jgi:hypothetical protein
MRMLLSMCGVGLFLFLTTATASGQEQRPLLRNYRGKERLPNALYKTYADLVEAMAAGDESRIKRYCLPGSVTVKQEARPEKEREYGQNINLPFLGKGFQKEVEGVSRPAEDIYLIRTATSALFFVETRRSGWKLFRYFDKPIE